MEVYWTPPNGQRTMFRPGGPRGHRRRLAAGHDQSAHQCGRPAAQAPPVVPPAAVFSSSSASRKRAASPSRRTGRSSSAIPGTTASCASGRMASRKRVGARPRRTGFRDLQYPRRCRRHARRHIVTMDRPAATWRSSARRPVHPLPAGHGAASQRHCRGPDGRIWIAHTGGNRLLILSPDGQVSVRCLAAAGTRQRSSSPWMGVRPTARSTSST